MGGTLRIGLWAVLGCLLGVGVAVAAHFATTVPVPDTHRYLVVHCLRAGDGSLDCPETRVPPGVTLLKAPPATLFVSSLDQDGHPGWWPTLPLYGGAGLVLGGLVGVARRQKAGSS